MQAYASVNTKDNMHVRGMGLKTYSRYKTEVVVILNCIYV